MNETNSPSSYWHHRHPRRFRWLLGGVLVLAIAVIVCGLAAKILWKIGERVIEKGAYQAVFLTNGQVYFGKLNIEEHHRSSWVELTDIYYLQVTQNLQQPATSDNSQQPQINLVKLGSELHGPQDKMFIEQDKILFWENLKDDSKVVAAIKEEKSKPKK